MKNIPDDVIAAFNKINAPTLSRSFTVETTGATLINIQHYDWRDIDSFGDAQSQIEFIKTIAGILSDDVTAKLIMALQGVKEDSSTVGFINTFSMVYNSVAVSFTVLSRDDRTVLFTHTVDHLKDETENKTPHIHPAQNKLKEADKWSEHDEEGNKKTGLAAMFDGLAATATHGKIVDYVAGILTYCALSSKYCENMRASEIKSHLIELVGPDIVEEAVKKVTSL